MSSPCGWTGRPDGSLAVSVCFNSWWTGLLASCGNQWLAKTTCGPSVYLSLCTGCLSFLCVCLTHASLQALAKTLFFVEMKRHFSRFTPPKFVISCTLSPFLLLFFLAQWRLPQSVGARSVQGVNCPSRLKAWKWERPPSVRRGCVGLCVFMCLLVCVCV